MNARKADSSARPEVGPATPNPSLAELVQAGIDRRLFLRIGVASTCAALMTGTGAVSAVANPAVATAGPTLFQFRNVPPSQSDSVVVPEGYVAQVLYCWGDPVNGIAPQFLPDASNSAADQALQAGMGHDGMEFFAFPDDPTGKRGLLAINHEYTDQVLLFSDGQQPLPPAVMPPEKVAKSKASHGISIIEIAQSGAGDWQVVDSPLARRITADSPMRMAGPAADRLGPSARGTLNNCAAGRTPWGTYLTCEENFQSVFGTNQADFVPSPHHRRYGLTAGGYCYKFDGATIPVYRWWEQDPRFDLARPDNDSDRFGYVVEIDPFAPDSEPVKRTALGRIKHENAEVVLAADGRVVIYMGDDEVNEHVYKFVSARPYQANPDVRGTVVGELLNEGTLYVARFEADGTGRWLALVPGENGLPARQGPDDQSGFDAADVCIRTREAATLVGATPMDRPEWLAAHPHTRELYVSLTNNKGRTTPDAANPRSGNLFGHILRWKEEGDDAGATRFSWQVFVLAGNPSHRDPTLHGNVAGDAFGCPDGLKFDSSGILWIQTDVSSSSLGQPGYAELGNNMMLAADPVSGEVRRFLTGPRGCEVTGNTMTPDRRTMFVNIQHPGEPADDVSDPTDPKKFSQWPDGPDGGRPRSATVAIRKLDGGVIGS